MTGKNLTPDEIAAHLYYEITWHGWEEEGQEKLAGLLDQVEAIERGDVKIAPFRDSEPVGPSTAKRARTAKP